MADAKTIARFFSKTKPNANGCLEWAAGRNHSGYGKFGMKGKTRGAHRVAWELANGQIPEGMWVLHSCDNTSCVLVGHLRIGTARENTLEAVSKGRWVNSKGSAHAHSKLTEESVSEIRKSYALGGITQYQIADKYGVNQSQISNILSRRAWGHI